MFMTVLVLEAGSITGSLLDQVLLLYHSPLPSLQNIQIYAVFILLL